VEHPLQTCPVERGTTDCHTTKHISPQEGTVPGLAIIGKYPLYSLDSEEAHSFHTRKKFGIYKYVSNKVKLAILPKAIKPALYWHKIEIKPMEKTVRSS
jgi:hypothetical protein